MNKYIKNKIYKLLSTSKLWLILLLLFIITSLVITITSLTEYKHAAKNEYVGPETCTRCHEQQASSWLNTKMAKSFEILKPGVRAERKKAVGLDPNKDYTHEKSCLTCHTTGYDSTGGFVSFEKTRMMAGVTCEACHGPGGIYGKEFMTKKDKANLNDAKQSGLRYPPKSEICEKCHNEKSPFIDHNNRFNYYESLKKGIHKHYQLKYEEDYEENKEDFILYIKYIKN